MGHDHDRLDQFVDTDPLALRDEAYALLARAEKAEAERDQLRETVRDYENTISFEVTCAGCAKTLDLCAEQTFRAEQAEAELERQVATIERVRAIADDMRNVTGARIWADALYSALSDAVAAARSLVGVPYVPGMYAHRRKRPAESEEPT